MILAAGDVMPDSTSLGLFLAATIGSGVLIAVLVPRSLRSVRLAVAVTVLGLIGPAIAVFSVFTGAGLMALSGHAVDQLLVIAAVSAATSIVVSFRLTRPLAGDLEQLSLAIDQLSEGRRDIDVTVRRNDEIGRLGGAINELSRTLHDAETAREASEKERQTVVCSLSHDLRTPLASLLASIDAMDDDLGQAVHHRSIIRRNITTMNRLVDDLFVLARAEGGRIDAERSVHDLAELVDEATEAVGPAASAQGVTVRSTAQVSHPVTCDPDAIGRALRNVLDNAIRFSPTGGTVTVSVCAEQRSVALIVDDEGPGFPPEFVERAFERFSQAEPARSTHGGAGLGLAIASSLIASHGGTVSIEPSPHGRVRLTVPST